MNTSPPNPLDALTLGAINTGVFRDTLPNCTAGYQSDLARQGYNTNLQRVYADLERIIQRVEMHPIHREHDDEDRVSLEIVNLLHFLHHNASHDTSFSGNCDICIEETHQNFRFLAEAKFDYSNTHIMEGFRQLADRYATRAFKDGAVLIYCRKENSADVLRKWKTYLSKKENKSKEFSLNFTSNNGSNFFETTHNSKATGEIFTVRHIFIALKDVASDKSARKKKKCNHTCANCCPAHHPDSLLENHI
ncbi:hypothetical protein [Vibrio pectenicida]|uniref:Uncharacterized protein n=1 Tax=Vibrio pectenicida TaxID=62763 RepID=A0A3R9E143_9VIBR|nr:hypothetical protein [Vibrio pectenicida]RSD31957.1 hypothetical protein EJA03_06215 [Vibrio pectenicida]